MIVIVACFIAAVSTAVLVTVWFVISYCELTRYKNEMISAAKQEQMHRTHYMKERGKSNEQAAKRILDNSSLIHRETAKSYNCVLGNPIYRFPGYIMGFERMDETKLE